METKRVKIEDTARIHDRELLEAAEILREGGLVAFPTETVYGLGANALDEAAARKIYEAKGRPSDNPLIAHVADPEDVEALVEYIPENGRKLMEAFWPGPLTMIFPKSPAVPYGTTGGLDTVAIRMPSDPVANRLIALAGVPVAAPSANTSGRPSPTTADHVWQDMNGRIDMIIDGGPVGIGVESTIVDVSCRIPTVLRPGAITMEMLREVLGEVKIDPAILGPMGADMKPKAPGMKYKHYAPKADVTILKGSFDAYKEYMKSHCADGVYALCFTGEEPALPCPCVTYGRADKPDEQAHALFSALRELDARGAKTVFARCPAQEGVAMAVYNRLLRAAAFRVVEV